MPKIVAVVQARMGSIRLPGKVLMEIEGKPMLWHILQRLSFSMMINDIVVAIPDTAENNILANQILKWGVSCYRGDEHNVLDRTIKAAKYMGARIIVRATGDNPLIDIPLGVDMPIREYIIHQPNVLRVDGLPIGTSAEIVDYYSLEHLTIYDLSDSDKEHVTQYFYTHADEYEIRIVKPGYSYPSKVSLTVDTQEDLEFVRHHFSFMKMTDGFYSKDLSSCRINKILTHSK